MITLHEDALEFRFPQVHADARLRISFQRTLRIPDDNRSHPLPPGLGRFPLQHLDDHAGRLPEAWAQHGGVMLPMYQAEALWLNFDVVAGFPCAVKIVTGKINAVTGGPWRDALDGDPQDYVVVSRQPWLDGFCVGDGLIRQFVAMPLGQGYTAEEQLTGAAEHGGLQIVVYPMKAERYRALLDAQRMRVCASGLEYLDIPAFCRLSGEMGLAPGGLMRQQIHDDEYGLDAWDTSLGHRCSVHMLNSEQWHDATGQHPPGRAPRARDYTEAGLPWFEHYDEAAACRPGAPTLAGMDSVAAKAIKLGQSVLPENDAVTPGHVVELGSRWHQVTDGRW